MNRFPVGFWAGPIRFLLVFQAYFDANFEMLLLCYFSRLLSVSAIFYLFSNSDLDSSDPMSTTRLVPPAPASPEKSFVFNQCLVKVVGLGPKKTVKSSFSSPGPLSLCLR